MEKQKPQTLNQALSFIEEYFDAPLKVVHIPASDALGYVLAEDIVAPVSLPRFDSAAMDGFAVRSEDLGPDGVTLLSLTHTIAAGPYKVEIVQSGQAARIMTGAVMPQGADRVVMQEYAKITGSQVSFRAHREGKPHIRRLGGDVLEGTRILSAGTRIGPGHLTLLIALGIHSVSVHAKPKVALLSTGDELVSGPGELSSGQIYDTNRPMLKLMLEDAGAQVTDLGIVRDDPDLLVATLVSAAGDHDLLISSGGASAGFADHLAQAVRKRGYLEFWKLDMRPGKPIGFGDIDDCPILLLPGNPVAAAIGFAVIGRSVIARLKGQSLGNQTMRLPMATRGNPPAN